MRIDARVEVHMDTLQIEGFHNDYNYLVEEVETETHKEVCQSEIVFFIEYSEDLVALERDLQKIVEQVTREIQKIEGN